MDGRALAALAVAGASAVSWWLGHRMGAASPDGEYERLRGSDDAASVGSDEHRTAAVHVPAATSTGWEGRLGMVTRLLEMLGSREDAKQEYAARQLERLSKAHRWADPLRIMGAVRALVEVAVGTEGAAGKAGVRAMCIGALANVCSDTKCVRELDKRTMGGSVAFFHDIVRRSVKSRPGSARTARDGADAAARAAGVGGAAPTDDDVCAALKGLLHLSETDSVWGAAAVGSEAHGSVIPLIARLSDADMHPGPGIATPSLGSRAVQNLCVRILANCALCEANLGVLTEHALPIVAHLVPPTSFGVDRSLRLHVVRLVSRIATTAEGRDAILASSMLPGLVSNVEEVYNPRAGDRTTGHDEDDAVATMLVFQTGDAALSALEHLLDAPSAAAASTPASETSRQQADATREAAARIMSANGGSTLSTMARVRNLGDCQDYSESSRAAREALLAEMATRAAALEVRVRASAGEPAE